MLGWKGAAGSWATWATLSLVLGVGCQPDNPCPEGQIEVRGLCVSDSDAGDDGGSGIVTCEPTGVYDAFGIPCEEQSDCSCPAGTCDPILVGACTELNCMRRADGGVDDGGTARDGGMQQVCPPDWTCMDVAGQAGVPEGVNSICVPPS